MYEKRAGIFESTLGGVKRFGQGVSNLAFGSKTLSDGTFDLGAGIKRLGKVRETHPIKAGEPLSGLIKQTAKGGDVYLPGRSFSGAMKDEWRGARKTRADFALHDYAKNTPISDAEKVKRGFKDGDTNMFGNVKAHPTGVTPGEYQEMVSTGKHGNLSAVDFAKQKADLSEMNNLTMAQFVKKHPGLAAKYYGTNILQKGFLGGLPAMEVYNLAANKEGPYEDRGMGANLGQIAGQGLGWAALGPLGMVGASLAVDGVSAITSGAGGVYDRLAGNKALRQPPGSPMPSNVLYHNDPRGQAKQFGQRIGQQAVSTVPVVRDAVRKEFGRTS